ncbi:Transcriptional regulator, MarR family [Stigmatella aurantiaca DW4/3-1]|nr:Transcriptional regulator, MarR family [Stigmatella aurantiaca DW4/3-1]
MSPVTGMKPLNADEEAFWRALGRVVHVLPRLLEEDLSKATGLSMTEYAVLLTLAEAPGQRLRMAELAAAIALSASRITRVVDDLSSRALVRKERHAADARGAVAVLTHEGLSRQQSAAPQHLASARRRVLDLVPPEHLIALGRVLQQVADRAVGAAPAP